MRGIHVINTSAEAHFRSGIEKLDSGRPRDAIEDLLAATRADSENAKYFAQLSRALTMAGRVAEALEAAQQALALNPQDALSLDTIGVVFSHATRHELAAQTFSIAVKRNPDNADFLNNLGTSLKFTGDFAGARTAFEAALKLNPKLHKVRFALANLERQSDANNHIQELQQHLRKFSGDIHDRMYLGYALAKELDDCGNYSAAFATLTEVNGAWREQHSYDSADDAAIFDALLEIFSAPMPAAERKNAAPQPIFVVGLPRTGTTLTERIISSHSDVFSAGELTHIPRLARLMGGYKGPATLDLQTVRAMPSINTKEFGRHYLAAAATYTDGSPYLVDKWPHNFLYTGLILQALPDAKVICVRRNPMDSCLSNFRQLFALGNPFYDYSYELLDCGRYYLMFDRLMQHWDGIFPGRIHTVHYEDLVLDQETQSRILIDYCGLEWQDACLNFERNASPVATASSAQVRQPLYINALTRWKNYAAQLEPLAELFHKNGLTPA